MYRDLQEAGETVAARAERAKRMGVDKTIVGGEAMKCFPSSKLPRGPESRFARVVKLFM